MNTTLKRLAFATMLALSLFASTSTAFAKDVNNGRETAWTDHGPVQPPQHLLVPWGITWE